MCSANDEPTGWAYDPPEAKPPRRIVTAGDPLPRGSVALAVLGEMLTEAEALGLADVPRTHAHTRVMALREARDRVAEAGG